MKLYDTFKDVYVGELSDSEEQELAKFASALVRAKAAANAEAAQDLVKQASEEIYDFDDFRHVANLCMFVKEAARKDGRSKMETAINIATVGGLLTSAFAPLAMRAYNKYSTNKAFDKSFQEIVRERPSLAQPSSIEQTRRNFGVIKSFSPDVAKNSLVSGNVLERMHRLGPAYMDINAVKEMANTQKFVTDHTSKGMPGSTLGDVGNAASTIGKHYQDKAREIQEAAEKMDAANTPEAKLKAMKAMEEYHQFTAPNAAETRKATWAAGQVDARNKANEIINAEKARRESK